MTFAISPLGAVPGVGAINPLTGPSALGATPTSGAVTGAGFGNMLTGAVNNLQEVQRSTEALAVRAVSGDLEDVHEYTIAASEAKLTMELTAAVRNKAVDAFNEIMRMQG